MAPPALPVTNSEHEHMKATWTRNLPDRYPEPPSDFTTLTPDQIKQRVAKLKAYLKYRLLHPTSRAIYTFPFDLQFMIDDYFDNVKPTKLIFKNKEIEVKYVTISDLMLNIGFYDNSVWFDYSKKEGFTDIVRNARKRVTAHYEQLMQTGASPAGAIFALKNIDNWMDKTVQDVNQTVKQITVNVEANDAAEKVNEL